MVNLMPRSSPPRLLDFYRYSLMSPVEANRQQVSLTGAVVYNLGTSITHGQHKRVHVP